VDERRTTGKLQAQLVRPRARSIACKGAPHQKLKRSSVRGNNGPKCASTAPQNVDAFPSRRAPPRHKKDRWISESLSNTFWRVKMPARWTSQWSVRTGLHQEPQEVTAFLTTPVAAQDRICDLPQIQVYIQQCCDAFVVLVCWHRLDLPDNVLSYATLRRSDAARHGSCCSQHAWEPKLQIVLEFRVQGLCWTYNKPMKSEFSCTFHGY
jgi:hypothetical protein